MKKILLIVITGMLFVSSATTSRAEGSGVKGRMYSIK